MRLFAAYLVALLAVAGCSGIPENDHLRMGGAARPEYAPPEGMTLAAKAARFDALLDRFISPVGQIVYTQPVTTTAFAWRNQSDQAIWTGTMLAAESMRYAATHDARALERVRTLARGLHALTEVTGVRGLYARSLWKTGEAKVPRKEPGRPGQGRLADYSWRGDVSKDQISGIVCGLGVAWALVDDPEVRAIVRADAAALADHLIEHDLVIYDSGGEPTTFGDMKGHVFGVPVGLHALIALAAYKVADEATGEAKYREAYDGLVRAGYPEAIYWTKFQFLGKTNHNNDNMQFLTTLPLLLLEARPAIREEIGRGLERTVEYVRHEGNAWFNYVAMMGLGYDRQLAEDAFLTMHLFPLDKRQLEVDVRQDPRFEHAIVAARGGRERCPWPLPINYRAQTAFAWRDDPYELLSGEGAAGDEISAPVDYLLAYWVGRYAGFISASE